MNWIWKLLGYHICERFTPWQDETHRAAIRYVSVSGKETARSHAVERTIRVRWCQDCGKWQIE